MLNFIKKYGLGFIIGAIIFGPLSYVTATTIAARNITYNGANTNANLTNVQQAIEELYIMSEAKPLISFTIDGVTYQAEEGMIWEDWCESDFNTIGLSVHSGSESIIDNTCHEIILSSNSYKAYPEDEIISNGSYTYQEYSCFTGDTKVKSEKEYINIEDIKVGDKVYSYNEITKTKELKEVTKTFIHDDNRIYEIRVGNKIIKVTPDHRIYVKAKYGNTYNWTKVYNIHEGDYLLDSNNKEVRIDSIKYYESKEDLKVYNIEVKDNHTYYVSEGSYLVHNAKERCIVLPS